MLNRPHRDIVVHPTSRTRLAESVQDEVFTDRMRFTRDGHLPFVVTAFRDSRSAVAAVEAGTLGNGFSLRRKLFSGLPFSFTKIQRLSRAFSRRFFKSSNKGPGNGMRVTHGFWA